MSIDFTEEERGLEAEFVQFLKSLPLDRSYWQQRERDHQWPAEFCQALAEGGWLGAVIPEAYGGAGMTLTEGCLICEAIARYAGINASTAVHTSIFGLHPLTLHGSDEMKARVLPRIAKGEFVAIGITEPHSGFETTRISTSAIRKGDKYVVNGRKVYCSRVRESSMLLLVTRTTPYEEVSKKTDGITLFLTEIDWSSGAIDAHEMNKMGRNAVPTYQFFMDDWEIPAANMIGEEGKGFYYLLDALNPERIAVAAQSVGLGMVSLDLAVEYARERQVFGRAIGQNQGIQFPLADSYCRLQAARLMTYRAARLFDAREHCGAEANIAKYLAAEACFEAADRAVQTLGGYGYVAEFDVERYFREARLFKVAPVSQEMVLNYVGQHVLGLPRSY